MNGRVNCVEIEKRDVQAIFNSEMHNNLKNERNIDEKERQQ